MYSEIIMDIVNVLIFGVCLIVTRYLVPLIMTWLKSKTNDNQYQLLIAVVESAVKALEQEYKNQHGAGATKKEAVIEYVKKYCSENGIEISDEQLDKMIESAVYGINSGKTEK